MAGVREKQGQLIFGLDIGTRSIVGTVGYLNNGKFRVMAQHAKEHETRAMIDGQIHDIVKVGATIRQVKNKLEDDLNRTLTDVCIAAAGRVLRTVTTYAEKTFENDREITEEDILALSTMGIEKAYEEFQKTNDTEMKFYCVGYTPMRYYMNGYQIGNLEGHRAKTIGIDLIATFLPDDVVDGLYKAVELADLHVANLTLEPIAAIQVAIPEKFRMLNLALVDVGAGTSDISITKEGTITAYGMIPIAGDSLTDIIVQHCLVDFETAEHIKRSCGVQEVVEYNDILGLPQMISSKEILALLDSSVNKMTQMVADCIKELNGEKPVSAVFVVGGGGMIPGYTDKLAEHLGIVKERVAIRGQEVMQSIEFEMDNPRKDAMMVTPIGICLSYYEQSNNFIFVEFNGERIKLYDNGKLSVTDAAMQMQYPNEDLFPKRGKALLFNVNGKSRMMRGLPGEASVIKVNGEEADLYMQIHNGDKITVTPSTMGEAAVLELGKLPELAEQLHVYVNGQKINLPKTADVNGTKQNEFYQIQDNDDIHIFNCYTVREVAGFLDVPLGGAIRVNDTPAQADTKVYENFTVSWDMNAPAEEEAAEEESEPEPVAKVIQAVEPEPTVDVVEAVTEEPIAKAEPDVVDVLVEESKLEATEVPVVEAEPVATEVPVEEAIPEVEEAPVKESKPEAMDVPVEEAKPEMIEASVVEAKSAVVEESVARTEPKTVETPVAEAAPKVAEASTENTEPQTEEPAEAPVVRIPRPMTVVVNHKSVTMNGKPDYIFVDVFEYIDFNLNDSRGRAIVTHINGRPAGFMENLSDGDVIDIYWK